ncbi:MAG TPA: NAD-dependent epimerase/dehydratase family protein, partial [Patescibacteria group bacterium]|nr:NAD-dependent epimerase/dehydratase family protein [Patescibacteria group bacterium]
MRKKIVITGGAGFIGSHITKLFCDEGYEVVVVDDLSFGHKKFVDLRATLVQGKIGDKKMMKTVLEGTHEVIHLAASSIIKFSFEQPEAYYANNVMQGIALLEIMRETGVKKIIYSSTAAVYGLSEKQPVKESDPKEPITIYGSSKLAFEYALQAYYHSFGIESVSLRYFNVYGPNDEQQPATRAVPIWIRSLLSNKPLPVFWQGKQLRDYIFVEDVARAHKAVLDASGCRVYNIGCGNGVLMSDIVNTLGDITGKQLATEE